MCVGDERDALSAQLSTAGEWLYEEGMDVKASVYKDKLKELNATAKVLFFRLNEMKARPDAIKKLETSLGMCDEFVKRSNALLANLSEVLSLSLSLSLSRKYVS
jgi:hypoxia up-regulated 1